MKYSFNTRWKLTKAILWLSSVAFFIPQIINWFAQFFYKDIFAYTELVLISSGEWMSLMLAVIGMYQLFNVARDHKAFNNHHGSEDVIEDSEKNDVKKEEKSENEGD